MDTTEIIYWYCVTVYDKIVYMFSVFIAVQYIFTVSKPRSLWNIPTWHPSGFSHITRPNQISPFLTSTLVFPDLGMSILFSSKLPKTLSILLWHSGLWEMFPMAPSSSLISPSYWSPVGSTLFCELFLYQFPPSPYLLILP